MGRLGQAGGCEKQAATQHKRGTVTCLQTRFDGVKIVSSMHQPVSYGERRYQCDCSLVARSGGCYGCT